MKKHNNFAKLTQNLYSFDDNASNIVIIQFENGVITKDMNPTGIFNSTGIELKYAIQNILLLTPNFDFKWIVEKAIEN